MIPLTLLSRDDEGLKTVEPLAPSGYDDGLLLTHWGAKEGSCSIPLDRPELLALLRILPTLLLVEVLAERGLGEEEHHERAAYTPPWDSDAVLYVCARCRQPAMAHTHGRSGELFCVSAETVPPRWTATQEQALVSLESLRREVRRRSEMLGHPLALSWDGQLAAILEALTGRSPVDLNTGGSTAGEPKAEEGTGEAAQPEPSHTDAGLCRHCGRPAPAHDSLAGGLLCPRIAGGDGTTYTPDNPFLALDDAVLGREVQAMDIGTAVRIIDPASTYHGRTGVITSFLSPGAITMCLTPGDDGPTLPCLLEEVEMVCQQDEEGHA